MFFQTMYNVVDTWAAGRLSTEALGALSASFPIFFLIIAVSHGCQAATNTLVSFSLGKEDANGAKDMAAQALFFAAWMSTLVGILGYLFTPSLLTLLQLEGEVHALASSYVRTLFLGTPFFVLSSTLNGMLSASGDTRPFRNALIAGFFLNIGLDLWFIFGGLGLPAMGFPGIARATVLLQALTLVYMWVQAQRKGVLSVRKLSHLHPRRRIQRRLAGQGFPAMVNMLTIACGIFVTTYFASGLRLEVLAAFGIATRIEQIILLPAVGLNTAAMTLAGHNLGANRPDRIRETLFTCLRFGGVIYLLGAPLAAGFAPYWISLFTTDPEVIQIGTTYLRISMLTFYAYVILFTFTSILQGLQRPQFAIWIGLYRQLLAPLLLIPLLMARLHPSELGIWWGTSACVWSGALLTLLYGRKVFRQIQPTEDT
jgi:putative MATE family efflux protein